MPNDYYQTLGVEKSASEAEIKKAYRRMAHKYHPDKKDGDEKKFKEVNDAYQVLGNAQKRQQYDQFGHAAFGNGGGGQGPFGGDGFGGGHGGFNVNFDDLGNIGDIFGDFFGGGRGRGPRRDKGQDIMVDMEINFAESILGVEKTINLRKGVSCTGCAGSGAEAGTQKKQCATCQGSGQVTQVQRTILGAMKTQKACDTCYGSGSVPEKDCSQCKGVGVETKTTETTVRIPAGISEGNTIKFPGRGEASRKHGDPGDLFVRVHVAADERFTRDGHDLHTAQYIPFTQAVFGSTVTVPTVAGEVKLKVPAGTQSGTRFRVRGEGVANRGDLYVQVHVDVPKKPSRKLKKVLEQVEDLL